MRRIAAVLLLAALAAAQEGPKSPRELWDTFFAEVKKGDDFRLRFGVLVHASPRESDIDLAAEFDAYHELGADED